MSQPFRGVRTTFHSSACPDIALLLTDDRLAFKLNGGYLTLSSAVHGGGFGSATRIVNWKVPLDYAGADPVRDFHAKLREWAYPPEATLGFLTAAKLTHASVMEAEGSSYGVLCCATAGTGNALRTGLPHATYPDYEPGTINVFVCIDGKMSPGAMTNAVITATEAKAAALQACGIVDPAHGLPATGTSTDAIAIAVSQSDRFALTHLYSGGATKLGNAIACLVYDTVYEAVSTQAEP